MTVLDPTPTGIAALADEGRLAPRGPIAVTLAFFRRQPVGAIGMVLVLIFGLAGIFAEWVAPYSPTANDFAVMTEPPSWAHWLGTDQLGRDLLSRILFGARTAFIVGLTSALVGGLSGLVIGVASAYFGGQLDLWHRDPECDRRDHDPVDPALRAGGALERAGDPRSALCRCSARPRLRPYPDHHVPYGAECDGAVPGDHHRVCRAGDPRRGRALLSRARRAGAGPGLGPDAARRRRGIRDDGAVDRHLSRPGDHADRVRHQPLRRLAARRARPQDARPLSRLLAPTRTRHTVAGLDPAIHVFWPRQDVGGRVEPGRGVFIWRNAVPNVTGRRGCCF